MQIPISYIPDAVPGHLKIFDTLMSTLPWHRRKIKSYGKTFDLPRDEVWIGERSYTYSGFTYPPAPWPDSLLALKDLAETTAGVTYNSVLLNLYRNGNDKVSWHCDCEDEMSACHPICSVSLGATRRFQVRRRQPKNAPIESFDLASGSILLMHAGMQEEWSHQIPAQPKVMEARINLTFRVMEAA